MTALLVGIFIGFVMCIPIGPINVWVINTHLKKGRPRALAIALGGSIMDVVYFFTILSGLSLIHFSESVTGALKSIGILLILVLGVVEFFSKNAIEDTPQKRETPKNILAAILLGIIIYTSNPTLIITMTGLGAFVKGLGLFLFDRANIAMVSGGLGLGSFLWFIFLVKMVDRYKQAIKEKYLHYFSRVSGILMIGLAIFMGIRLFYLKDQ